MYSIKLLDKTTDKVFTKTYESYYLYNKAVTKYKHSNKLQIISMGQI